MSQEHRPVVPIAAALNPFAEGFYDDPYVQYRDVRTNDPVHHSPFGLWFLSRWTDCHQVLRLTGTSVQDENSIVTRNNDLNNLIESSGRRRPRSILGTDPPNHTRIRKLMSKAFTPRTVANLEPRVAELVDRYLDAAIQSDGTTDIISTVAFQLPFQVIHEMLGMPDSVDRDELRRLSQIITKTLDPVLALEFAEEILTASGKFQKLLSHAIVWKRENPADDLLTALIQAEDSGETLSDIELQDNLGLIYLAGHETTVNLIGNGVLALLRHPEQAELLRRDSSLDANAIEELLRYDSPVQFSRRIAVEPFEIAGQTVKVGEIVMTGLGAANRDPDKFGPTAEQLDITRVDANHHISFGSGVHHCLGAALARLEGRVAIPRIIRRFPNIALATETPQWNGRMVLRGLSELPVTLG